MKRVDFEDKSYIEVSESPNPGKVFITIAAKSVDDNYKLIVNSVEITVQELISLSRFNS